MPGVNQPVARGAGDEVAPAHLRELLGADLHEAALAHFVEDLDESRWQQSDWMGSRLWFYDFPEGTLWGATAFMVRSLLALLRDNGSRSAP